VCRVDSCTAIIVWKFAVLQTAEFIYVSETNLNNELDNLIN